MCNGKAVAACRMQTITVHVCAPHVVRLQALSCAAIDDVLAWCVLALASSFAKSGSALLGLYTTLLSAAYVFFMIFALKPCLALLHGFLAKKGLAENRYYLSCLFLLLLASAFTTEGLGIHCFFGGFVAGLVMPKEGGFAETLASRMELVVSEYRRWFVVWLACERIALSWAQPR